MTNQDQLPSTLPPAWTIDPTIIELANDPLNEANAPTAEREKVAFEAVALSRFDGFQHMKVFNNSKGEPHWAYEYPNIFTFDGNLRGQFDDVDPDSTQRSAAQQIATFGNLGGELTDVIIETDAGEQFLIRKTNNEESASKQTFELVSTGMVSRVARERNGARTAPRAIDTQMLAGVVLLPGHPMRLGKDPQQPNKRPRSLGNITKITGLRMAEDGKVAAGHSKLQDPGARSDAVERFNETVRTIRQQAVGKAAGTTAVGDGNETVLTSEE